MIEIREEGPDDLPVIREVNKRAFGQDHQREGVGSKLIEAGTRKLKEAGYPFIIVLGHADYYPRFGFKPASTLGSSAHGTYPTMFLCCW